MSRFFLCLIHILIHKGEGKLHAPPNIIGIFFFGYSVWDFCDLCRFDTFEWKMDCVYDYINEFEIKKNCELILPFTFA